MCDCGALTQRPLMNKISLVSSLMPFFPRMISMPPMWFLGLIFCSRSRRLRWWPHRIVVIRERQEVARPPWGNSSVVAWSSDRWAGV